MADNSSVLAQGTKIMKNIITADIMQRIGELMEDCTSQMESKLHAEVPGMTGNTRTSSAGATFNNKGELADVYISGNGSDAPLSAKLREGQIFHKGRQRYDGRTQESNFKATVDTTGNTSQRDNYDFLASKKGGKDFKMVIVGGTEYLGEQQVTDNYAYCETNADKYFQRKDV